MQEQELTRVVHELEHDWVQASHPIVRMLQQATLIRALHRRAQFDRAIEAALITQIDTAGDAITSEEELELLEAMVDQLSRAEMLADILDKKFGKLLVATDENFTDEGYLSANLDVALACRLKKIGSGREHYEFFGKHEGRKTRVFG